MELSHEPAHTVQTSFLYKGQCLRCFYSDEEQTNMYPFIKPQSWASSSEELFHLKSCISQQYMKIPKELIRLMQRLSIMINNYIKFPFT